VALSPWPTTPVATANAIATLRANVAGSAGAVDEAQLVERLRLLGAAAAALVEAYAADAPESIKDTATIRCAGWLAQAPAGGQRREDTGDVGTVYSPAMTGALAASGAKALLSPWRVRRAGAA